MPQCGMKLLLVCPIPLSSVPEPPPEDDDPRPLPPQRRRLPIAGGGGKAKAGGQRGKQRGAEGPPCQGGRPAKQGQVNESEKKVLEETCNTRTHLHRKSNEQKNEAYLSESNKEPVDLSESGAYSFLSPLPRYVHCIVLSTQQTTCRKKRGLYGGRKYCTIKSTVNWGFVYSSEKRLFIQVCFVPYVCSNM